MSHLIIMRHGETQFNVESRFQGQLNNSLNENGKEQIIRSATELKKLLSQNNLVIDKVQVSDLKRAVESYEILKPHFSEFPEAILTKQLREKTLGSMEGFTIREYLNTGAEAKKHYHQHLKDIAYNPKRAKFCEDSESTIDVAKRIYSEVEKLNSSFLSSSDFGNRFWLFHGSAIRYTLDILQVTHYKKIPKLGNGDILFLKPMGRSLSSDISSLAYDLQSNVKWELVEHIKIGNNISANF